MSRILLALCALVAIANPGNGVSQATQNDPGREVTITPLAPTSSGHRTIITSGQVLDQMRLVVRDRDTWAEVWKRINSGPDTLPLPEIDFSREILVVAAMGWRPSSGYQIVIDRAVLYEQYPRLEVFVRTIDNTKCPGLGMYPVLTAPIDIVRIPGTKSPVVIREIEAPNCPKLK